MIRGSRSGVAFLCGALFAACSPVGQTTTAPPVRPSILLVTLDTTRWDVVGPDAKGVETPAFNALAARGTRFSRAYATVPETLPSHLSMMSGLYPAGHGVHENARSVPAGVPLLAEALTRAGYFTQAFISSFVLAKRFGLARGFSAYDDVETTERSSRETTDRAIAALKRPVPAARFLWVHYFDAHTPYAPAEPFKSRYAKDPYLGEIAAQDEQLGRLLAAFEKATPEPRAVVVVGDHGEGLGDHGEKQHGHLLYDSTMRVPLVVAGPGVSPSVETRPVSVRHLHRVILGFAGLESSRSTSGFAAGEVVLGEAMKPFLEYGWQPQTMAVDDRHKVISAGRLEVYDAADPGETRDLAPEVTPSRAIRDAIRDYPLPSKEATVPAAALSEDDQRKLASLGYVSAGTPPVVRKDAPRPVARMALLDAIEEAGNRFVREDYRGAIPLFTKILAQDAHNLDAALRLAAAHSALGNATAAETALRRARDIAPDSRDVRVYEALHRARGPEWREAGPLIEKSLSEFPERLPLLEALAWIREREGRASDAVALWRRIHALRSATAAELTHVGALAMEAEDTAGAIRAFEDARAKDASAFRNDLELGVLYLDARRFKEARDALDRVAPTHPAYAMVLFKRAQVSVLLKEPDAGARIEAARRRADATTAPLIARERLFER